MTKTKSTKRALLMSALSLLMCVSMLIGSTFAWFTDSVTSAGNIIKSGTLDVTMEWFDGTKAVPAADSADWIDASTGAIFKSELWEPGYTEVRHIKIANVGTLALKYQLNILANGDVSELADVIDVYYVDPAVQVTDRTALTDDAYIGTLTDVLANISTSASGNLLAGENHTITLALKMKESAGNYYQDMAIGSDFSIQLLATQYTFESDSFDDQYDANAWTEVAETPEVDADGVVTVWTAEQLAGVMSDVKGVKTINIMENIDLSGRNWTPANFWDPENLAQLTINGNGHTISNMTANGSKNVGFIGSNSRKLTIKDLTFENADVTATGNFVGTVIGYMYGNVTLENVDVIDSTVVSTGTYGIRVGGLVGLAPNDTGVALTIKDCDVTGSTISGYHNVGAMVGSALIEVACTNSTAKNNTLIYGSSNVGAFAFGAYTSGYTEYVPASGFTAENNIITKGQIVTEGLLKTADRAYSIMSKEGLMNLYTVVSANPGEGRGDTITLLADIDMAGETWQAVDTMWMTFDGNNHTISNLTCAADVHGQSGLFAYAGHVTIKNLTLNNVTSTGSQAGAFIANSEGSKLENCKLTGKNTITFSATSETYNGIGALIGWNSAVTLNNVEITDGTTVTLNAGDITSVGKKYDNITGYGNAPTGTATNNGEITVK